MAEKPGRKPARGIGAKSNLLARGPSEPLVQTFGVLRGSAGREQIAITLNAWSAAFAVARRFFRLGVP